MNWDRLKIFYVVASEGSLSKAAHILNLTQSALSRQIAQLEHETRQILFIRLNRGLSLTEAGKILLPTAEHMYHQVLSAKAAISQDLDSHSGPITLIAPTTFHSFWLMKNLAHFSMNYGDIQISIISSEDANYHHRVREDVYIQITSYPPDSPEFICQPLCKYPLHFYCSDQYIQKHGLPRRLEDLDNHRLIGYESYTFTTPESYRLQNPLLFIGAQEQRTPFISVEGEATALKAVEKNLCIGSFPEYVVSTHPSLIQIDLEDRDPFSEQQVEKFITTPQRLSEFKRIKILSQFIEECATRDFKNIPA